MSKGKMIGIFALGFAIGGVVGTVCGYFYGEDKFKKEKLLLMLKLEYINLHF